MWQILAFLIVGCCYSSAEQHNVTIAAIPVNLKKLEVNGSLSLESRMIIDGNPAPIERYPYAVQVLRFNLMWCTGSLLTRSHVLSAAHCFVNSTSGVFFNTSDFSCRVGSSKVNTGGSVHRVSGIINHELHNITASSDHDISVVTLSTTVTLSASVATAILHSQGEYLPDNATVWVAGWGATKVKGSASPILNEVSVYTINWDICKERYITLGLAMKEPFLVTHNMLCTGLLDKGGRDVCHGDSGGPVIYNGTLVGVSSWGTCGDPYFPGVNTRVAAYTNWINSIVTGSNGAPSLGQTSVGLLLLSFLVATVFSNKLQ